MAIFSPKARRFVQTAVDQLPDDFQRETWNAWARTNLDVRRPGDSFSGFRQDDLPDRVAVVALGALDRMAATLSSAMAEPDIDEDEACDLEGDISLIKAIEAMLIESLHASRHEAAAA